MSYQFNVQPVGITPLSYSYIRFSTPDQLEGDSQRRQLELSINYCEKNNLKLNESTTIKDLGVSALQGTHIKEGFLGHFFEAVKTGTIERGSYLLIEDFDRLSRQDPLDAQNFFPQILKGYQHYYPKKSSNIFILLPFY